MTHNRAGTGSFDDLVARCARRCVEIIAGLLRPEEVGQAIREFEAAIREELAASTDNRS